MTFTDWSWPALALVFLEHALYPFFQQRLHVNLSWRQIFNSINERIKRFRKIRKKGPWPTCHCSNCWDNSIFCCIASINWLFICMTSILVLANEISVAFFLKHAWRICITRAITNKLRHRNLGGSPSYGFVTCVPRFFDYFVFSKGRIGNVLTQHVPLLFQGGQLRVLYW